MPKYMNFSYIHAFIMKFTEVKETHRCYRQDIGDTLVSLSSNHQIHTFFSFSLTVQITVSEALIDRIDALH